MQFLATLLDNLAYLNPLSLAGWMVWLGLAGLLAVSLLNWRKYHPTWTAGLWGVLGVLLVAAPIAALFLGIKISTSGALPMPGMPEEPPGSTLMVFSAIPWTLAGGLLGPVAAAAVGMLSGLARGIWDTHSFFSTLEVGLMAAMFAVANRQRYRTFIFRLLRQPLFSALSLVVVHAFLFLLSAFFTVSTTASVTQRLDYALSNLGAVSLAFAGEMFIAGLVAQIALAALPLRWGTSSQLQPSPAEKSIETRFISGTGTIISLLLITLLVGDWIVAGRAARNLLRDRLESSAELASQNVPFFLETGQNLALQIASDPRLQDATVDASAVLGERMQSVAFFNQLVIVDLSTHAVTAAYPTDSTFQITRPEDDGLNLVQLGVPNQVYTVPPLPGGDAAGTSFVAAIPQTQ